jgi:hypothetical protein
MVEQLNFSHWSDEDKTRYFTQDAQEEALQQQMRILVLQKELAVLKDVPVASVAAATANSTSDSE